MFCPNCGDEIKQGARFCVNCGYKVEGIKNPFENGNNSTEPQVSNVPEENKSTFVTTNNQPVKKVVGNSGSYYDGSVSERLLWSFLGALVTFVSLGICTPIAQYWLIKFDTEHTVVNNKRMIFKMGLGEFFGFCFLNYLLILVTLGIWGLYFPYKLKKKVLSNTYFEGEDTAVGTSNFDGNFWKFLGMSWIVYAISFATFGLAAPFAYGIALKWENNHSVVSNRRLYFNTNLWVFTGLVLLHTLLVVVTFGIYGIWFPVIINRLIVKDVKLMDSVPENERVSFCSEKLKLSQQILIGLSFVLAALFITNVTSIFTVIGSYFAFFQFNSFGGRLIDFISMIVSIVAGLVLVIGLGTFLLTDKKSICSIIPKALILAGGFKLGELIPTIVKYPLVIFYPNYLLGITAVVLMMIVMIPFVKQDSSELKISNLGLAGALTVSIVTGYFCNYPVPIENLFYDYYETALFTIFDYIVIPLLLIALVAYILRFYIEKNTIKTVSGILILVSTTLIVVTGIIFVILRAFSSEYIYLQNDIIMMIKLTLVLAAVVLSIMAIFAKTKVSKLLNILYIIFSSLILVAYIIFAFIFPKLSFDFGSFFNKSNDYEQSYEYSYDDYSYGYDYSDDNYGIYKGARMTAIENLRLRESESKNSATVVIMRAGTKVEVLDIGKYEVIDGIHSYWIKVKILKNAYDTENKRIAEGTIGWCYGGYLD
ncbi:MAG: DUF898 family protein [Treponema sp.]|nr:DUF898 family protein [Treponema sp.]